MRVLQRLQRGAEGLHDAALREQLRELLLDCGLARARLQLRVSDHADRAPGGQEALELLRAFVVGTQVVQRHEQLDLHVRIGGHVVHDADDFDVLFAEAEQLAHRALAAEDLLREGTAHHGRPRLVEQNARLPLKQLEAEDVEERVLAERELVGVVLAVADGDEALSLPPDSHRLRDLGDRLLHRRSQRRHRDAHDVAAHAEGAVDTEHAIDALVAHVEAIERRFEAHVDEDEQRARDADYEADHVDQEEQRIPLEELPAEVQVLQEHVCPRDCGGSARDATLARRRMELAYRRPTSYARRRSERLLAEIGQKRKTPCAVATCSS
jgi:hypothetical protein